MFLGLSGPLIRGMDPASSKTSEKNLNSYCSVTSFDFLSLKNDVNIASKSNKQKNLFLAILKVTDENRIRIRIHQSEVRIRGSGCESAPKCHGSATLVFKTIKTTPKTPKTTFSVNEHIQKHFFFFFFFFLIFFWGIF